MPDPKDWTMEVTILPQWGVFTSIPINLTALQQNCWRSDNFYVAENRANEQVTALAQNPGGGEALFLVPACTPPGASLIHGRSPLSGILVPARRRADRSS